MEPGLPSRLLALGLAASIAAAPVGARAQSPAPQPPPSPPAETAPAESPAPDAITPPRTIRVEDPVYPEARLAEGGHPTVVFLVVIDAEGRVRSADVEHTAGEDFDAAAREALMHWEFEPARRGTTPIASRIRVSVHFELPELDLPTTEDHAHDVVEIDEGALDASRHVVHEPGDRDDFETALADSGEASARAEVEGAELRTVDRSASEVHLDRRAITVAPHRDAAQMLESAPGLVVTRPEGDAVAHRILLRGFDAEHGQDIELTVSGIPMNQPSHLHGQGYADLTFLIPEVVRGIRVREGVYDPTQGDFAVAGSADFELGTSRRGITAISQMGSFRTFREAVIVAPTNERDDTFVAFDTRRTDGFGQNRSALSGNGLVQWGFDAGPYRMRILAALAGARSDTANVVRRDDLGRVGFYGVYDDDSARSQNAFTARGLLALLGERRGENGQTTDFAVHLGVTDFRSQTNFTGYTQSSQIDPTWRGRGDLIEQRNLATTLGFRFRYRSTRFAPFSWLRGHLEAGTSGRMDRTEQAQNLLQQPQNQTWDRRIDATILGADLGLFADLDLEFGEFVSVRAGMRADALFYDVSDALGNFIPAYRRDDYILGYRRTAFGVAAGPRVSVDVHPLEGLSLLAAYGEGYRSPQAITLEDGERAPYTKVRSADVGIRYRLASDDLSLDLTGSGFFTQLSDDLVFDPGENRYERIGRSRRVGAMVGVRAEAWDTLYASASVTGVKATLLDPPPATADDPDPPFVRGSLLPYVPPVVVRADLGVRRTLARLRGEPLTGNLGVGLSYVGRRPLPYSERSDSFTLLDAQLELGYRGFGIGLSAQNLVGMRYAASEYYFASNWDPSAVGSRLPTSHVAAGAPRTFLVTFTVNP